MDLVSFCTQPGDLHLAKFELDSAADAPQCVFLGCCVGEAVFQLGNVNSLWCLLALQSSLGLHANVELGHKETVVCPTFCTAHGLGDPYIVPVPLPDDANALSGGASRMSCSG